MSRRRKCRVTVAHPDKGVIEISEGETGITPRLDNLYDRVVALITLWCTEERTASTSPTEIP